MSGNSVSSFGTSSSVTKRECAVELAYSVSRSCGLQERDDGLGDVEPVDEVVEDGLHRGVLQEVAAVVHEQQRVRRGAPEPGRQVHRHRARRGAAPGSAP